MYLHKYRLYIMQQQETIQTESNPRRGPIHTHTPFNTYTRNLALILSTLLFKSNIESFFHVSDALNISLHSLSLLARSLFFSLSLSHSRNLRTRRMCLFICMRAFVYTDKTIVSEREN